MFEIQKWVEEWRLCRARCPNGDTMCLGECDDEYGVSAFVVRDDGDPEVYAIKSYHEFTAIAAKAGPVERVVADGPAIFIMGRDAVVIVVRGVPSL